LLASLSVIDAWYQRLISALGGQRLAREEVRISGF
jgi:hypothetical protein